MKLIPLYVFSVFVFVLTSKAQTPEVKFIADTLVVQADGTFETDPDLATLTFDISSQDKELKPTYDKASVANAENRRAGGQKRLEKGRRFKRGAEGDSLLWRRQEKKHEIVSGTRPDYAQGTRLLETRGHHGRIRHG